MVISPLSQLITMCPEDNNFLMWKYQIENVARVMVLKVSCLEQQVPPKMVIDETGFWFQIPSSEITNAKIICMECNFLNFNSQSSQRLCSTRVKCDVKKDGLAIRDYLTKMKNYCDLLATAGHKISTRSYTCYNARGSSSSWNSNGYPSSGFQNRNQFGGNQMTRGSFVPNRGRGRGRAQGGIKPQCQLCNKFGHTVHRCFYRYDPNFHGNMPANGPTPGVLGSGARNGASGSISSAGNVNLTEYDAQEDQDYSEMEAMVATPEDLQNCCWFPDSGATNHVTHDLGNLNSGAEYNDDLITLYSCRQSA
ncbi:hypothetical protein AAG906_026071 [Vitis piasezkii]